MEVDGSVYDIRPGFRNILKILRLQNDPDVLDGHKAELLRRWFFDGEAPEAWAEAFGHFVRAGDEPELPAGERDFDYEFDAPEIYASFRQLYGIDLMDEDLHWWAVPRAARRLLSLPLRAVGEDPAAASGRFQVRGQSGGAAGEGCRGDPGRRRNRRTGCSPSRCVSGCCAGNPSRILSVPKEMHYERRDTFF